MREVDAPSVTPTVDGGCALAPYVGEFLGYGNPAARYWFVGMEHGGGGSVAEIDSRLLAWDRRGRRPFEDAVGYHDAFNYTTYTRGRRWFGTSAIGQPTWWRLAFILLAAEGRAATYKDAVRRQAFGFGATNGAIALTEVGALPSPHMSMWPALDDSSAPYLRSRAKCNEALAPSRLTTMCTHIDRHNPCAVVCYGESYRQWWQQLAECQFVPTDIDRVSIAHRGSVPIYAIRHPVSGITNRYLAAVGDLIRRQR